MGVPGQRGTKHVDIQPSCAKSTEHFNGCEGELRCVSEQEGKILPLGMEKVKSAERKLHISSLWVGISGLLNLCSVFKLPYAGAHLKATQLSQERRFLCSEGTEGSARVLLPFPSRECWWQPCKCPLSQLPGWACWHLLSHYEAEHGAPPDCSKH